MEWEKLLCLSESFITTHTVMSEYLIPFEPRGRILNSLFYGAVMMPYGGRAYGVSCTFNLLCPGVIVFSGDAWNRLDPLTRAAYSCVMYPTLKMLKNMAHMLYYLHQFTVPDLLMSSISRYPDIPILRRLLFVQKRVIYYTGSLALLKLMKIVQFHVCGHVYQWWTYGGFDPMPMVLTLPAALLALSGSAMVGQRLLHIIVVPNIDCSRSWFMRIKPWLGFFDWGNGLYNNEKQISCFLLTSVSFRALSKQPPTTFFIQPTHYQNVLIPRCCCHHSCSLCIPNQCPSHQGRFITAFEVVHLLTISNSVDWIWPTDWKMWSKEYHSSVPWVHILKEPASNWQRSSPLTRWTTSLDP